MFWANVHLLEPETQSQRIRISSMVIVLLMISHRKVFDIAMRNLPFYSSKEDVQRSAEATEYQPNAVCFEATLSIRQRLV